MHSNLRSWLKLSFFNLMLVAFIGVILRYKIAYSLPFVDQKNLLHGHSHFAFAGWITQALMALMVAYLSERAGSNYFIKYRWLLYANCLAAYGMLFSFPFEGYAFVSIMFSTGSVFVSYFFSVIFWKDINRLSERHSSHRWFKIALLGNIISSVGPFSLAYMLATKHINPNWYLASIYFFLHFQYNGWFFFTCMGLLIYQLEKFNIPGKSFNRIFLLFALACLPTYFLSVLWWPLPVWLYILVVLAAISQLAGWALFIHYLRLGLSEIRKQVPLFSGILFLASAFAMSVKLCLQAGSVIPSLSKLAFGFRPIVIGYLHLVLLGVITIFIIAYTVNFKLIDDNKFSKTGIGIFVSGIFINEILLMIQGVSDLRYVGVPFINQSLLIAAGILFSGIFITVYGQLFRKDDPDHKFSDLNG